MKLRLTNSSKTLVLVSARDKIQIQVVLAVKSMHSARKQQRTEQRDLQLQMSQLQAFISTLKAKSTPARCLWAFKAKSHLAARPPGLLQGNTNLGLCYVCTFLFQNLYRCLKLLLPKNIV